jgi:site-specific recombinase XerD
MPGRQAKTLSAADLNDLLITRAARIVHKAGGSLRDVQLLAGHRSIQTTQRYIDGDSDAQRKLVAMI